METPQIEGITGERMDSTKELLDGGARLEPTSEQVEGIRREMIKERLDEAIKVEEWEEVGRLAAQLAGGNNGDDVTEDEPNVKLPEILDYKKIEISAVRDYVSGAKKDSVEAKEVQKNLENVRSILGEEMSSLYSLESLTVNELSHLSAQLDKCYGKNLEGETFKKEILKLVNGYHISRPDFKAHTDDSGVKNLLTRIENGQMLTDGAMKQISEKVVRHICKSPDHGIFREQIVSRDSLLQERILKTDPVKMFVAEYALFMKPSERENLESSVSMENYLNVHKYHEYLLGRGISDDGLNALMGMVQEARQLFQNKDTRETRQVLYNSTLKYLEKAKVRQAS